jgi:hypothetical protein
VYSVVVHNNACVSAAVATAAGVSVVVTLSDIDMPNVLLLLFCFIYLVRASVASRDGISVCVTFYVVAPGFTVVMSIVLMLFFCCYFWHSCCCFCCFVCVAFLL